MLKVMEEREFPVSELIPAASERSAGALLPFRGASYEVVTVREALGLRPDLAFFSAGGQVSLDWAEAFAAQGAWVIDNSSAWRMKEGIPLVVPEVNGEELKPGKRIIANPNCSTIQMVVALNPLHRRYGIGRIVVSTYQSVTGTGARALEQLEAERAGKVAEQVYPHPIDRNCIPQCDVFTDDGYTKEELKIVNETRKILGDDSIRITATCVRVPVVGGHSESVNVTLKKEFDLGEVRELLSGAPGIVVEDDPAMFRYPMPRLSEGRNEVFVGRIRRDFSHPNSLNLWIVADNLRKGAATNAVQIAELLVQNIPVLEG